MGLRCLVVPVDVGKSTAKGPVCRPLRRGHCRAVRISADEPGFALLASAIARSEAARFAEILRVGVESGYYHRTLVARLRSGGYDVVEMNPAGPCSTTASWIAGFAPGPSAAQASSDIVGGLVNGRAHGIALVPGPRTILAFSGAASTSPYPTLQAGSRRKRARLHLPALALRRPDIAMFHGSKRSQHAVAQHLS